MINLQNLKYFIAAAESENLSKAAAESYISQPYLSKVVSGLEHEFGVPLFDRVGRNLRLNQNGAELLRVSRNIMQELDELRSGFDASAGRDWKQIKIALNIPSLLPLILKSYMPGGQAIAIDNVNGSNSELKKLLLERTVDFCITSPPFVDENITAIELITEELKLYVPPDHPYAGRTEAVPLSEFKNEPFLVFKKGYGIRDNLDVIFSNAGFVPHIKYESGIDGFLRPLVELGFGVSLLPKHLWEKEKQTANAVSISYPLCERKIGISFLRDAELSAEARRFREHIVDLFANPELMMAM
jgi:DNA-binding transcriptional LysR family regulator